MTTASSPVTTRQPRRTVAALWRRIVLCIVAAAGVALCAGGSTPAVAAPVPDLNNLPPELMKYKPGTPEFAGAPWMTSPTCHSKGGDFSIWTASVITDASSLLTYFQSSQFADPGRSDSTKRATEAILAGYQQISGEIGTILPPGYCVDDVKRWVGSDYTTTPFGFAWGQSEGAPHQINAFCTDRADPNATGTGEYNRYFGAERAPCDGFYISCDNAQEVDKAPCEAWNTFSDEYIRRVAAIRDKAYRDNPGTVGAPPVNNSPITPGDVIDDVVDDWFQDLTRTVATGAVKLMAEAMTFWTTTDRSNMLMSPAITEIQNLLRYVGILLLAGGVTWQGLQMVITRKIAPLVTTGTGLLTFVGWSTLGGSLAVLLNEAGLALANQVLDESIAAFSERVGGSLVAQVPVATGAVFFLSIILFCLGCIQWALGFFRMGALVILLALLPTAAAGQLTEAGKPWLRKVISWCLALILYQPIAAVVFAIGLQLIGNSSEFSTVLVGMAVIALAVISMPTMLRFFDWGGQQLVSGGGGGAGAVGAAASMFGGAGIGSFTRFMDYNGPGSGRAGGSNSTGAASVSSAHTGQGPADAAGSGGDSSTSDGSGGTTTLATPAPGGSGGSPGGVASAAGGAPGSSGSSSGGSAGAEAAQSSTGSAAAGVAGAGAAGAVVAGAGAVKDGATSGFNAASGALTDGTDEGEQR